MTRFPRETQHTCLLTTDKEPMMGQSKDTTKVQLGEPMSFIGVTYFIGVIGAEMA